MSFYKLIILLNLITICYFANAFSASVSNINPCYTYNSSCEFCLSHFVDRQCGYCYNSTHRTGYCMMIIDKSECKTDFYYGIDSKCPPHPPPVPTSSPSPSPSPSSIPTFERSECKNVYKDCFTCRSHFADRSCGWCKQEGENKCYYGHYDGPYNGDCDKSHWVYGAESLGCDHSPAPRHSPTPTKHNNNSKGVKYLIIGFSIGGVLLVIVFVAIGIFVHRRNTKGGYQFVGDFVRAEDNFWDEQNSDSETDIDPNNNKDDNDNFDTEQILDVQIDSDNEEEDENENEEDSDNSSNSGSNSNSQSSLSSSYSSSEYQNENNPFKVGKISDENL